jgi:enoyl-CoA hydratase/carnithine racemase
MGLTGDKLRGKDLAKCGVATHFVPLEKIDKMKNAIIEKSGDISLASIQEIVNHYSELVYSQDNFSFPKSDEINRTFLPDNLDEIYNRLNQLIESGSEGEQTWAANVIKTLDSYSPLSLVVTLEQIKKGIHIKTLEEAYNIEAQMVSG